MNSLLMFNLTIKIIYYFLIINRNIFILIVLINQNFLLDYYFHFLILNFIILLNLNFHLHQVFFNVKFYK